MATSPSSTIGPDGDEASRVSQVGLLTLALALVMAGYAAILVTGFGKPNSWLIDDKGQITFTDYAALWGAGRLALEGKAAAAYDWALHAAAMAQGVGRTVQQFPFPYPPTFLAVMAPFAALPYVPSLIVWSSLTLVLYLATCAWVVGRWEGAVWLGAMIVTLGNFIVGQNGFLTAALMGGGLMLLTSRPVLGGMLLGLLAYKPHLGLLLPVALAASGCWRAFGAAAATVVVTALGAMALFGQEPWWAFADNLSRFGSEVMSERFTITHRLQSAYGMVATLGAPKGVAMAVQGLVSVALVALVAVVWRSAAATALKSACLITAAALVSPYVFVYDLTLLAMAQAFLLRHWLAGGMTAREVVILVAVNTLIVLMMMVKLPTGFLASALLLGAIVHAAWPALRLSPPIIAARGLLRRTAAGPA